jgi:predicted component of type VI protein secretion system
MAKLLIQMPDGEEVTQDLPEDKTTIGRLADNSLIIQAPSVSSHHAEIFFKNNAFFVKDLHSTNGTFLNDEQITESALNHGDELCFGSIATRFESQNDTGALFIEPTESEAGEAQTSCRPANFHCSSPLPIERDAADPRAKTILIAAAVTGLLAIGGAVYMITQIPAPTF